MWFEPYLCGKDVVPQKMALRALKDIMSLPKIYKALGSLFFVAPDWQFGNSVAAIPRILGKIERSPALPHDPGP
jgi:hypothetical protein